MATPQQLVQLEEQLNVLESQGSIFFDKLYVFINEITK